MMQLRDFLNLVVGDSTFQILYDFTEMWKW